MFTELRHCDPCSKRRQHIPAQLTRNRDGLAYGVQRDNLIFIHPYVFHGALVRFEPRHSRPAPIFFRRSTYDSQFLSQHYTEKQSRNSAELEPPRSCPGAQDARTWNENGWKRRKTTDTGANEIMREGETTQGSVLHITPEDGRQPEEAPAEHGRIKENQRLREGPGMMISEAGQRNRSSPQFETRAKERIRGLARVVLTGRRGNRTRGPRRRQKKQEARDDGGRFPCAEKKARESGPWTWIVTDARSPKPEERTVVASVKISCCGKIDDWGVDAQALRRECDEGLGQPLNVRGEGGECPN
ncbi:hypothetical protein DFH09DRAFT_1086783 [Mycena vulgaris]|nr:hypothetical protein DFH09DRAFT_1086783 [Mycena vulgaris]